MTMLWTVLVQPLLHYWLYFNRWFYSLRSASVVAVNCRGNSTVKSVEKRQKRRLRQRLDFGKIIIQVHYKEVTDAGVELAHAFQASLSGYIWPHFSQKTVPHLSQWLSNLMTVLLFTPLKSCRREKEIPPAFQAHVSFKNLSTQTPAEAYAGVQAKMHD